jgi:hypothetical protein
MTQAYAKPSIAGRVVQISSAWLAICWLVFLAFICGTTIDKQSVYLGKITFYGSVLYLNTALALLPIVVAWCRLAYTRHPFTKRAALWVVGAFAILISVHLITQSLIIDAIE